MFSTWFNSRGLALFESNYETFVLHYTKDIMLFLLPYYLGYKAMALYPIQGHPRPYNGYKGNVLFVLLSHNEAKTVQKWTPWNNLNENNFEILLSGIIAVRKQKVSKSEHSLELNENNLSSTFGFGYKLRGWRVF